MAAEEDDGRPAALLLPTLVRAAEEDDDDTDKLGDESATMRPRPPVGDRTCRFLGVLFANRRIIRSFSFAINLFLHLLRRLPWTIPSPSAPIHRVSLLSPSPQPHLSYSIDLRPDLGADSYTKASEPGADSSSFFVLRDDLLHPLANGNKARKLDALLPLLLRLPATDLVTCGGCQSSHAAAVAVYCAKRGIRSHLLLRGERPEVPTGYNLISEMFGSSTVYVARSAYIRRNEMLLEHAHGVAGAGGEVMWIDDIVGEDLGEMNSERGIGEDGSRRVVIVNEGAASSVALLGVIRLVDYLAQANIFGKEQKIRIVLDAGTGTTAVGLALGVVLLGLPWKVTAVMLADTVERYKEREKHLISEFKRIHQIEIPQQTSSGDDDGIVQWVERIHPRRFGKVLDGEIEACRHIARQTGILLDPMYTLAAWERAVSLARDAEDDAKAVMLHTGGTLNMFGLAQRYRSHFSSDD
ncbi:putative D-cysteine desulfhydrase 2, mitochondrial [Ananas comosus]|uniref:D-cysteine desulfhydrase 2, mitochondrial n=1 Tax=Ananas comosus TaxID=4615 RepID=A0A6P5FTH7_ANACO|nr:putative D-cysteine desulfhydrase 2, mitochondrial [Ananas comosus]